MKSKSPENKQKIKWFILLDLFMMLLLLMNLGLIVFDWIFDSLWIQACLKKHLPAFFRTYDTNIHQHFTSIDLAFVAVFLLELLIRWAIAIFRKTHHKWFFYPFVHWYDTLGCIPVGSFRFLRILRIVSILIRLQKLKIVDLTKTYLFQKFNKYLNILVEEISDRVVINVLSEVQKEVENGSPIIEKIVSDVVLPKRNVLVEWISNRVQVVTAHNYGLYKADIQAYVNQSIENAVAKNQEIKRLERVPVMGNFIRQQLEKAIADIVFNVLNGIVEDLASEQNKAFIDEIAEAIFETILIHEKDENLNEVVESVVVESLEVVKKQVAIQQWKEV